MFWNKYSTKQRTFQTSTNYKQLIGHELKTQAKNKFFG